MVKEKRTKDIIGLVTLKRHHDQEDMEISYQLLPRWWGTGYATEVIQVIIQYAFDRLKL